MPSERPFVEVEPTKSLPVPEGRQFLVLAQMFGRRLWATELSPVEGGPPIRLDRSLYRIAVYHNGKNWIVEHIGYFVWVRDEGGALIAKLQPYSKRVKVGGSTYKLDQSGVRPTLLDSTGKSMITFVPTWKDSEAHSGCFVIDESADFGEQLPAVLALCVAAIPLIPKGVLQAD